MSRQVKFLVRILVLNDATRPQRVVGGGKISRPVVDPQEKHTTENVIKPTRSENLMTHEIVTRLVVVDIQGVSHGPGNIRRSNLLHSFWNGQMSSP